MPYADPERQKQYYQERDERRRNDQEFKDARNARHRDRYANDEEYRQSYQEYQSAWRKEQRRTNPVYRAKAAAQSLASGRRFKGMRWTPKQKAEFDALTACEVCGTTEKKLHMDHCHDCGWYRGGLCSPCNTSEGHLRKWSAVCPEGSPMRVYMDRHVCPPSET